MIQPASNCHDWKRAKEEDNKPSHDTKPAPRHNARDETKRWRHCGNNHN